MSWNNFPKCISNKLTKLWMENKKCEKHDDNDTKLWIRVPYIREIYRSNSEAKYTEIKEMYENATCKILCNL